MMRIIILLIMLNLTHAANAQEENIYHIHNDHNGAPLMMTDQNQRVVWKAHYTPYGEAIIEIEEVELPVRAPGQYYDKESGLHHNYYRDYNSKRGSYQQADRIGILRDYSDPQLQVAMRMGIPLHQEKRNGNSRLNHPYVYVDSNPIMRIDPFGLENGDVTDYRAWARYNTGDYSAGIEYSQPDTRTLEEIDCGLCKLNCTMVGAFLPGPFLPTSKSEVFEYTFWNRAGAGACDLACNKTCNKSRCN